MNWLAHLYLSEPTAAFRLGNLLPDLVSATSLATFPAEFQPGIERHRDIDRFTDTHPIFRQSIRRLPPEFRRYGGVLIDMFYDHILAREWGLMATQPLPEFAAEVYASIRPHLTGLPPDARYRLTSMCVNDRLCSYREVAGIAEALARIGEHFRRPVRLAPAAEYLERAYDQFRADFREFFPQLMVQVLPQDSRAFPHARFAVDLPRHSA